MSERLKPCPFCGGEAERHTIGDEEPSNRGGDVICCPDCGASSHVEFGRKENLVSLWNRRALSDAISLLIAERERQISAEGWTPEHDDAHDGGELAAAAAMYALYASRQKTGIGEFCWQVLRQLWPWDWNWFKTPIGDEGVERSLVKAGALIVAELERRARTRA